MKEQCFLVRKDMRGRGVTVLSRDKTEVSRGAGEGGECRKMGHKCLEKMTLKCRSAWNVATTLSLTGANRSSVVKHS